MALCVLESVRRRWAHDVSTGSAGRCSWQPPCRLWRLLTSFYLSPMLCPLRPLCCRCMPRMRSS